MGRGLKSPTPPLSYFVPQENYEPSATIERWRAELVVKAGGLTSAVAVVGAAFYALDSPLGPISVALATCALVAFATPWLVRWTGRHGLAGNVLNLGLVVTIGWLAATQVQARDLLLPCVTLAPGFALLYGGQRDGFIWLVLTTLSLASLFLLGSPLLADSALYLPLGFGPFESAGLVGLSAMIFCAVLLSINLKEALVETIREKESRTSAILQTAADGIVTVNEHGIIQTANQAAIDIFRRRGQGLVGCRLRELIPTLDRRESSTGPQMTLTRYKDTAEHLGRRPNGEFFPLELSMGGFANPAAQGPVLVFRDISERKRVEESLREARDQALEASQAKSTFLANMSHELRTPLNATIGYSEMLIELMADDGVDTYMPDLDRIRIAGRHLLSIIDDVLDLSKIQAGKMEAELRLFSLEQTLADLRTTLEPSVRKNGNQLLFNYDDAPLQVISDQKKIRQILTNLLSNAAKFTHEGTIRLTARLDEANSESGMLIFEVEDNGIGMTEEELDRIFVAFTQADNSTTRKYGGTGLGLTICQHFCDLLDGQLDVASRKGEGTIFTVRLPVELQSSDTSRARVAASALDGTR